MVTESGKCFICGKRPNISYDFLAIEKVLHSTTTRSGGALWETTQSNERLAGFLRLPLCGECLQKRLLLHIAANTRKSGAPQLMKGTEVKFCRELLAGMKQGIFENSDAMKLLFVWELERARHEKNDAMTGGSSAGIIKNTDKSLSLSSPSGALIGSAVYLDHERIEPEYVLAVFTQPQSRQGLPFTKPLLRTMERSNYNLYFVELMNTTMPKRLAHYFPTLISMYDNYLKLI